MNVNVIIVDEKRKNRQKITNIVSSISEHISTIEALDGGIASHKFENQKIDMMILNVDTKKVFSINLVKDLLTTHKLHKENIIFMYEAIEPATLKNIISFGISDVLCYSTEDDKIKQKILDKITNIIKQKTTKKVA